MPTAVSSVRLNAARNSPSAAVVLPVRGGSQYLTILGGTNAAGTGLRTVESALVGNFGVLAASSVTGQNTFDTMVSQVRSVSAGCRWPACC